MTKNLDRLEPHVKQLPEVLRVAVEAKAQGKYHISGNKKQGNKKFKFRFLSVIPNFVN